MKTKNLLKLALMMVAMFVITGAIAQGTAVPGQVIPVNYATDAETYVVVGDDIPLYALPDPVYHSDWDYAAADWTLTAGFLWNWARTGGANDTGAGTLIFSQTGVNDNYVEISVDDVGQYEIQVTEEASAAYGSCEGSPTTLLIQAVATPAITFGALDGTTPSFCDGVGLPTDVITVISGGWQNYRVAWSLEIATLGAGLAKDFYYDDETGAIPAAGQKYAVENTEAAPATVAAAGNYDLMTVTDFLVIDNKPTVYTYQLTSINDQALRFGNFIALGGDATVPGAFDYNAFTGATGTYTVQVNPAPTTGPIYHIPATWAN